MSSRSIVTFPILVGIGLIAVLTAAAVASAPPTIVLEKPVHFLTPSGEDVLVGPGTYEVDAAKEGLQLTSQGGEGATAVVVKAQALPHGESLTAPKVDVQPAGEDQYRVALLLPDGTGLEAVGSYSGVLTRGLDAYSTAYGGGALRSNTTGAFNTAMGWGALMLNTTGQNNTAVGYQALFVNTTASANTAMGVHALLTNTTGQNNTAMGAHALYRNTIASGNTAMGFHALSANRTGENNTAVGNSALKQNSTGIQNTAMGFNALFANTTGNNNIAMGPMALRSNTTGAGNIAIGAAAGFNQTMGNHNIYLYHAGVAGESVTIRFGTPGLHTRAFLAGVAGVPVSGSLVQVDANGQLGIKPSSRQYKEAIENMGTASQGLLHLRPVTFRYKQEVATGERLREYGLIAEEVAEVYPELVGRDAEGQIVTVQYHELIPMLLNELQQQHRVNEEHHRQLEALTARVAELEAE